jgi:protein phosphatase
MDEMSDQAAAARLDAPDPGSPASGAGVHGAAIQGGRSEQQDSFRSVWLAGEQAWLLLVADGMGGHAAGGFASRLAADTFVSAFAASRARGALLGEALQSALDDANARIARGQQEAPDTEGMGTTLVGAHLSQAGLAWVSVGDSPMWLFRSGAIEQLNEDHSFRPAVKRGAKAIANMLQSVLNGQPIPMVDLQARPRRLRAGDLVILASDGVLTLDTAEIAAIAARHAAAGPEAVVRALLAEVEGRGKARQDNCTILVAVPPAAAGGAAGGARRWGWVIGALIVLAAVAGFILWRRP